jgi:hypothetical protein
MMSRFEASPEPSGLSWVQVQDSLKARFFTFLHTRQGVYPNVAPARECKDGWLRNLRLDEVDLVTTPGPFRLEISSDTSGRSLISVYALRRNNSDLLVAMASKGMLRPHATPLAGSRAFWLWARILIAYALVTSQLSFWIAWLIAAALWLPEIEREFRWRAEDRKNLAS